jgi:hypothetical protein
VTRFHDDVRAGHRDRVPGAVRVSANKNTYLTDVAVLGEALREIADTPERAAWYQTDAHGDVVPRPTRRRRTSVGV